MGLRATIVRAPLALRAGAEPSVLFYRTMSLLGRSCRRCHGLISWQNRADAIDRLARGVAIARSPLPMRIAEVYTRATFVRGSDEVHAAPGIGAMEDISLAAATKL